MAEGNMSTMHRWCVLTGALVSFGCGARTGLPIDGQNGVVQTKHILNTKETCTCFCTGEGYAGKVTACLPPSLNPFLSTQGQIDNKYGNAPGNGQYDQDTAGFCTSVADQLQQFTGWDITPNKSCAASNQMNAVKCTCTLLSESRIENDDCKVAPMPKTCSADTCIYSKVFDLQTHTIDTDQCDCSVCDCCPSIVDANNPPNIFRPVGGGVDPMGMLGGFLEAEVTGKVDDTNNNSAATATMTITDNFNNSHSDTKTATLHGDLRLYGRPNQDGSGSFLFDAGMSADDVTFHLDGKLALSDNAIAVRVD
jgi:hypothetical protein